MTVPPLEAVRKVIWGTSVGYVEWRGYRRTQNMYVLIVTKTSKLPF
jgi:hypothetical protein